MNSLVLRYSYYGTVWICKRTLFDECFHAYHQIIVPRWILLIYIANIIGGYIETLRILSAVLSVYQQFVPPSFERTDTYLHYNNIIINNNNRHNSPKKIQHVTLTHNNARMKRLYNIASCIVAYVRKVQLVLVSLNSYFATLSAWIWKQKLRV